MPRTRDERAQRRSEGAPRAQRPGRSVEREVRSQDPSLSPEANELLTGELRDAVGADRVRVPEGAPDRSRERHGEHTVAAASTFSNRPLLGITLLAALVVGGIIALATGQWWVLVLALGLHALTTMLVSAGIIQMTTRTEHVSPEVAARLEEEGVADPDAVLTDLVQDYSGAAEARGAPEVVSSGRNELTARPDQDPARATVEQRTAMTPSSGASVPAALGGTMNALEWWVVLAVMVVSLVAAAIVGGLMWVAPAIVLPVGGGWMLLQNRLDGAQEAERGARGDRHEPASSARPARDARRAAYRRVVPIVALVTGAVAAFVVIIGAISGSLT